MELESLEVKRAAALARVEPQRRARQEALTAAAAAARARIAPSKDKAEAEREALLASAAEARKRIGASVTTTAEDPTPVEVAEGTDGLDF
jgi:hypothetical protein